MHKSDTKVVMGSDDTSGSVDTNVDVVIVGCGPTGATLSLLLAQFGVSTLILEREKSIYPLPRAVHFDDQIMRIFQTLGIADTLEKVARYNPGMRFVDPGGKLLLDWPRPAGVSENGWYSSYRFHQPDLEAILRDQIQLRDLTQLKTQVDVTKVEQNAEHVNVMFKNRQTGVPGSVQARYVVGCDGARSIVRQRITEDVEDLGFNARWLVVDVLLNQDKPGLGDFTIQHCGRDRPATYVRCPSNRRRWEISLKPEDDLHCITSNESIWSLIGEWLLPCEATIERSAVYEFQSLIAKKWRKGRLFIAGDAAHLTPPFMGQGMCAGIRDVSNLSWKLAKCCIDTNHSDSLKESLLDSYESERIPNVREYIEKAIQLGALIESCDTKESLKKAFDDRGDTSQMKSIVPRLGSGLVAGNELYQGAWFPQPLLSNGQRLDERVGNNPVLLISKVLLANFELQSPGNTLANLVLSVKDEPELAAQLVGFGVEAVLVRPDHYVLGTASNLSELRSLINSASLFV
jgi:3-(3-hydroxy-phenyl)propionate hydroxylase